MYVFINFHAGAVAPRRLQANPSHPHIYHAQKNNFITMYMSKFVLGIRVREKPHRIKHPKTLLPK
jgi:hypothetical protein